MASKANNARIHQVKKKGRTVRPFFIPRKSGKSRLTSRQRCCVVIPVLYALQRRERAGAFVQAVIRKQHMKRLFFEELFLHLSLLVGFPAMLDGLERLQQIQWPPESRRRRPKPRTHRKGLSILRRIYGKQTDKLIGNFRALHPEAASWIVRDVYQRVFARHGMTLQERELVNIAVLSIQGLKKQLYSHIRGAIRIGLSSGALEESVEVIEEVSGRQQNGAREFINQVVSQTKK